jgi:tRNA A-37 threonylcarbamoyl transferase component Bud32
MTPHTLNRIVCRTRGYEGNQNPAGLLSIVEKAVAAPVRVIKEITKPGDIKRTLKANIDPWGPLCIHEYLWDVKRTIVSPVRLSRAERTWQYYDEMLKNRVAVPEPVLFLELKKIIFSVRTYIATRWIEGATSLHHLALKHDLSGGIDFQTILCKGVDSVVRLHEAGFIHRDLKWSNLHYAQSPHPDIHSDMVLTDFDALKKSSSLRAQGTDFARFLIAPKKYPMNKVTVELLIQRYLAARDASRSTLEKAIRNYLAHVNGP